MTAQINAVNHIQPSMCFGCAILCMLHSAESGGTGYVFDRPVRDRVDHNGYEWIGLGTQPSPRSSPTFPFYATQYPTGSHTGCVIDN